MMIIYYIVFILVQRVVGWRQNQLMLGTAIASNILTKNDAISYHFFTKLVKSINPLTDSRSHSIIQASCWPLDLKQSGMDIWNIWGKSNQPINRQFEQQNNIQIINQTQAIYGILKTLNQSIKVITTNKYTMNAQNGLFSRYLIYLVIQAHYPLYGSFYNDSFSTGDDNGNKFMIKVIKNGSILVMSLRQFWSQIIASQMPLNRQILVRPLNNSQIVKIIQKADYYLIKNGYNYEKQKQIMMPQKWTEESKIIAQIYVYGYFEDSDTIDSDTQDGKKYVKTDHCWNKTSSYNIKHLQLQNQEWGGDWQKYSTQQNVMKGSYDYFIFKLLIIMKSVNSVGTIKYKNFAFYNERYFKKLNEPNSLIEPLNLLCGGWFLETFKQVINKLSTNKTSPLPLFFPNAQSMELITKNKVLRDQTFNAFDTRALKRIDACQLYCALIVVSKGSFEIFLKTIVDVFGFEYPGRILKDQFFFFLDSFFRAIPKIVIIKNYSKPIQPNIRLQYEQISNFVKTIFGDKQEIERNQIYESMMRQQPLNQFIRYIQKKCNGSAEKCRNETIQRVGIQSEVRGWLMQQIDQIQINLNQQRFDIFKKVLG